MVSRLPARDHPAKIAFAIFDDDARSALRSLAPRMPTLLAVSRPKARHALEEHFTIAPISERLRRSRAPRPRSVSASSAPSERLSTLVRWGLASQERDLVSSV
jgi:hypothetical protein